MERYEEFLDEAFVQIEKEYSFFKHVDDDKRNLQGDNNKQANNKEEILNQSRTDKRLKEELQSLINF